MSGQQSEQYLAAGCALRESRSPSTSHSNSMQRDDLTHNHQNNGIHRLHQPTTLISTTPVFAVYCWGESYIISLWNCSSGLLKLQQQQHNEFSTIYNRFSFLGRGEDGQIGIGDTRYDILAFLYFD